MEIEKSIIVRQLQVTLRKSKTRKIPSKRILRNVFGIFPFLNYDLNEIRWQRETHTHTHKHTPYSISLFLVGQPRQPRRLVRIDGFSRTTLQQSPVESSGFVTGQKDIVCVQDRVREFSILQRGALPEPRDNKSTTTTTTTTTILYSYYYIYSSGRPSVDVLIRDTVRSWYTCRTSTMVAYTYISYLSLSISYTYCCHFSELHTFPCLNS